VSSRLAKVGFFRYLLGYGFSNNLASLYLVGFSSLVERLTLRGVLKTLGSLSSLSLLLLLRLTYS